MTRFRKPVCIYIVLSNMHHQQQTHFGCSLDTKKISHFIFVFAYMLNLNTKRGIFSECDSHEFNWNINPRQTEKERKKWTVVLVEELDKCSSIQREKTHQRTVAFLSDHPNSIPFLEIHYIVLQREWEEQQKTHTLRSDCVCLCVLLSWLFATHELIKYIYWISWRH